ncbi:hypothetical protein BC938DRAFT_483792 [Jimgerdemannia flammicorona]|uniref:Mitochondrial import receptor subunit TOM7 homolog n=1 Tax=Jimgerdemannia flammicorona TaxID=994334 RepID=A0A433QVP5_9FUNG|nr:hypothetical protein BC938DRAFT_483792 [Jimgerdemannia flammicorona]
MQEETKEKILKVIDFTKHVVHWGFIPFVIYLGRARNDLSMQYKMVKSVEYPYDVRTGQIHRSIWESVETPTESSLP